MAVVRVIACISNPTTVFFLCENRAIKAERVGLVQPGEEKAPERLYSKRVL